MLVAYNPESNSAPGELRALVLRADSLTPTGQPLTVRAGGFPHNVSVRPTSAGFVLAYGAIGPGLTRVWTSLVACAP